MCTVQPVTLPVAVRPPTQPQAYISASSRFLVLTERCTGMPSGRPRWASIAAWMPVSWSGYGAAPAESAFRQATFGSAAGDGFAGYRYAAGAVVDAAAPSRSRTAARWAAV